MRKRAPCKRKTQGHGTVDIADDIITEDHGSTHSGGLTLQQARAVDLLVMGKTDGQVGAEIGVARECVNRWRNHNPHVIAALNNERLVLWQASRERLRALGDKALNVLDNALDAGDTKVALGLLKLRAADPSPTGPTDLHGAVLELAQRLQIDLLIKTLGADDDSPILQALKTRWMGSGQGGA
ncbi:MAG: hypothetical protein MUC50_23805 [Myxococcota bacterium]|nr:hypothetical protein [Myxococcota bacterium]